jgi:YD repeat-containing protein
VTSAYDVLNRNAQVDYGTSIREYAAVGNRKTRTGLLGVTRYLYDKLNRLKQVTDPFASAVQSRYDPAGDCIANKLQNWSCTPLIEN